MSSTTLAGAGMVYLPLERRVLRGVLGLRLRDTAMGAQVTSGLNITAWRVGAGAPLTAAVRAQGSGIYGFRSLPGLEAYVRGETAATDYCADEAADPNYVVAIEDGERRFLPQLYLLCLPRVTLLEVPLYANPARSLTPGIGTIRGQVVDKPPAPADPLTEFTPASWAVVQAQAADGPVVNTVCDERGAFVLFVPYPKPGLTANQWSVDIRVQREPSRLAPVADVPVAAYVGLPAMGEVLAQAQGTVYDAVGDAAAVATVTRTLTMGVELVVESSGGGRRLYVEPA